MQWILKSAARVFHARQAVWLEKIKLIKTFHPFFFFPFRWSRVDFFFFRRSSLLFSPAIFRPHSTRYFPGSFRTWTFYAAPFLSIRPEKTLVQCQTQLFFRSFALCRSIFPINLNFYCAHYTLRKPELSTPTLEILWYSEKLLIWW